MNGDRRTEIMDTETSWNVAFVFLPFGAGYKPAIGISLLKSALEKKGVKTDIHYLNLKFACLLGLDYYDIIACSLPGPLLLGEWIFASSIFGDNPSGDRVYIEECIRKQYGEIFSPTILYDFLKIRDIVPGFLDSCMEDTDWSRYFLIGFSAIFQQQCASLAFAKLIKDNYPHIKILFGGSQCFGDMGRVLMQSFPFIDYICIGEGDIAVPALISAIMNDDHNVDIPGILVRDENSFIKPAVRSIVHDLDSIPYPDYSDYLMQISGIQKPPSYEIHMLMETSRGCWWAEHSQCTFCGLNTEELHFRYKSPERTGKELQHISDTYGRRIDMTDTIIPPVYFSSLLPLVSALPDLSLTWEMRPNLSKNKFRLLRDAGVSILVLGIESLSNSILLVIHKGTTLIQIIQSLKWGKEHGIRISWNLLYGFPGEDPGEYQKMQELIPLIIHYDPPAHCSHVHFDRWSQYWKEPASFGMGNIHPSPVYRYIYHTLTESEIEDFAYFYEMEFADTSAGYAPGLKKYVLLWHSHSDARLDMACSGTSLHITDTRRCGEKKEYDFDDVASLIYLQCDKAQTIGSLCHHIQVEEETIREFLNHFLDLGLMISSQGKYLSLAVKRF